MIGMRRVRRTTTRRLGKLAYEQRKNKNDLALILKKVWIGTNSVNYDCNVIPVRNYKFLVLFL